nr:moricin-like peptide 3 [Antheraea pernyi]
MKLFSLFVVILALMALMMGGTSAAPKGAGKIIRKGGKVIKHGLTAIGVIGTGHEVYREAKNQG